MEKSKFTLINSQLGDPPPLDVAPTEFTVNRIIESVFTHPPGSMDVATPEGWVRCYSDGRDHEFISDHVEGADPRESARKWWADRGL